VGCVCMCVCMHACMHASARVHKNLLLLPAIEIWFVQLAAKSLY